MREGKIDVRLREVFSGSSVHGDGEGDRMRYDTIMDWLTDTRNEEQVIKGNKEEINVNGRRVLELANDTELEIVNRWEGRLGKWTRI